MADEKKLGVYICSGCDIGDCIDVDKLKEDVSGESQVALCKTNKWLCNQKGVDEIRQDVAAEGLDGVVIAACSPRYLTDVFDFGEEFVHDRVNLREQVAWTHEPMDKYTYDMALDYVKMGIAKVENCELPEPKILDNNDSVMVVGGGVTGMSAARSCSKAGYNVVLIEKEAELGGFYGKLHKLTPSRDPYYELEPTLCDELIAEVRSDPRIKVLTGCEIEKTDGQPGMYDVTAKLNGDTVDFQVASIIQATGWKQYDARKIKHLHYGDYKNVITNIEMEKLAKEGNIVRPSDGKAPESVVFVQCAGSRDKDHLPYCSSVCCMTSLKQAIYIREKYPDTRVYIIYKDIRTPGQYEMFYKRVQNEDNIFLTKGEISGMEEASDGSIKVMVDETLLDDNIDINADMVVLATGMVPSTAVAENGQLILDKKPIVDDEEKKDDDVPEAVEADPLELPHADILSLTY
ncbi:MAG: CoB--CoM heterodisulfide reductase iron-sulfur subunit A family protein, partial [Bacteroidota bacterium]